MSAPCTVFPMVRQLWVTDWISHASVSSFQKDKSTFSLAGLGKNERQTHAIMLKIWIYCGMRSITYSAIIHQGFTTLRMLHVKVLQLRFKRFLLRFIKHLPQMSGDSSALPLGLKVCLFLILSQCFKVFLSISKSSEIFGFVEQCRSFKKKSLTASKFNLESTILTLSHQIFATKVKNKLHWPSILTRTRDMSPVSLSLY